MPPPSDEKIRCIAIMSAILMGNISSDAASVVRVAINLYGQVEAQLSL